MPLPGHPSRCMPGRVWTHPGNRGRKEGNPLLRERERESKKQEREEREVADRPALPNNREVVQEQGGGLGAGGTWRERLSLSVRPRGGDALSRPGLQAAEEAVQPTTESWRREGVGGSWRERLSTLSLALLYIFWR